MGSLGVHRMNGRKKGAQSPESTVLQIFMCAFMWTEIFGSENGEKGGYESDYEEGNGRL